MREVPPGQMQRVSAPIYQSARLLAMPVPGVGVDVPLPLYAASLAASAPALSAQLSSGVNTPRTAGPGSALVPVQVDARSASSLPGRGTGMRALSPRVQLEQPLKHSPRPRVSQRRGPRIASRVSPSRTASPVRPSRTASPVNGWAPPHAQPRSAAPPHLAAPGLRAREVAGPVAWWGRPGHVARTAAPAVGREGRELRLSPPPDPRVKMGHTHPATSMAPGARQEVAGWAYARGGQGELGYDWWGRLAETPDRRADESPRRTPTPSPTGSRPSVPTLPPGSPGGAFSPTRSWAGPEVGPSPRAVPTRPEPLGTHVVGSPRHAVALDPSPRLAPDRADRAGSPRAQPGSHSSQTSPRGAWVGRSWVVPPTELPPALTVPVGRGSADRRARAGTAPAALAGQRAESPGREAEKPTGIPGLAQGVAQAAVERLGRGATPPPAPKTAATRIPKPRTDPTQWVDTATPATPRRPPDPGTWKVTEVPLPADPGRIPVKR